MPMLSWLPVVCTDYRSAFGQEGMIGPCPDCRPISYIYLWICRCCLGAPSLVLYRLRAEVVVVFLVVCCCWCRCRCRCCVGVPNVFLHRLRAKVVVMFEVVRYCCCCVCCFSRRRLCVALVLLLVLIMMIYTCEALSCTNTFN